MSLAWCITWFLMPGWVHWPTFWTLSATWPQIPVNVWISNLIWDCHDAIRYFFEYSDSRQEDYWIIHQNVFLKNKNISNRSSKERKCKAALRMPQWEAAPTVATVPGPEILEMKSKNHLRQGKHTVKNEHILSYIYQFFFIQILEEGILHFQKNKN